MLRWSRVRLYLSILTCEGLFATLRERVQFAPPHAEPPKEEGAKQQGAKERGGKTLAMPRFYDYAGAMHVHSTYSDGAGTVEEVAAAASRAGLDFVALCDHSSLQARADGKDGWRGRTLVLIGTEITTDAGHLLALGVPDSFLPAPHEAEAAQTAIRESGGLGFVALPCDLKDHWRDFRRMQDGIGLEVFNLSAIARTKINLPGLLEVWRRYNSRAPQRAFSMVAARPVPELRVWDALTAAPGPGLPPRRVVGIGSLDAHAVMKFGGRSYPFPTYEETFRTLRTHLLTSEPLSGGESPRRDAAANDSAAKDSALVYSTLALGHCYMAYDNYADPTGFTFEARPASSGSGGAAPPSALMGDALTLPAQSGSNSGGLMLTAQAPRTRSLVRLYRDGRLVAAARGGRLDYAVPGPGVYRIEVYLYRRRIGSVVFGARPWIFSNPIYVQPSVLPAPASSPPMAAEASAHRRAS